jgi:hypothetical protein
MAMSYHDFSWGSAEVFYLDANEILDFEPGADEEPLEPGWYWASGQPGCLWDGEPTGPFNTEAEALEDAEGDNWGDDDEEETDDDQ